MTTINSPFNGDAMVMYAWYVDARHSDYPLTWINHSLREWLDRQALGYLDPAETQTPNTLKTFLETVISDPRVAEITLGELTHLAENKNAPVTVESKVGPYLVVVYNRPPSEGGNHLASVRIVAPAGIPLRMTRPRPGEAIALIDMVSVLVFNDKKEVIGFQGQLQEAGSRVATVREQASRAAVASVMSRNMSHNLGSHVLARLSGREAMRSALGRADDEGNTRTVVSAVIDLLWPLCSFVRSRMDFVADIATASSAAPAVSLPVVSQILYPLATQLLVAQNLCASHAGSTPVYQLQLEVRWPNGPADRVLITDRPSSSLDPRLAGLSLGVPNGVVGCQAIYAILENLIRNSAKYSAAPLPASFRVTVRLDLAGVQTVDRTTLLPVVVYDDLKACADPETLKTIEAAAERPLLTEDMLIESSARGLKEMKAAAAYLRRLQPAWIDDNTLEPPLLTPKSVDDQHLGYLFYVLLPTSVVLAGHGYASEHALTLRTSGIVVASSLKDIARQNLDPELAIFGRSEQFLNASDGVVPLRQLKIDEASITARFGSFERTIPVASTAPLVDELESDVRAGRGFEALASARELWTRALLGDRLPALRVGGDDGRTAEHEADGGSPFVLYARHGSKEHLYRNCQAYEPYSSPDPMGILLGRDGGVLARRLQWELIESASIPILVLDERVQQIALQTQATYPDGASDQTLIARLAQSGILVPDYAQGVRHVPPFSVEGPLLFAPVPATRQDLSQWVIEASRRRRGDLPPLLVVHLGLLESAGIRSRAGAEEWVRDMKQHVVELFITSGRGVPERCPENARFIPLSTLLVHTIERRSKYHLLQALIASGRPT